MRVSAVITTVTMIGSLVLCGSFKEETCAVNIRLSDLETGRELPGLLRITDDDGNVVLTAGLLSRGIGLDAGLPINQWLVLPKSTTIELPRKKLTIEAIAGLERESTKRTIDLTEKKQADVSLSLTRFFNGDEAGYKTANTHLHLQKVTREQCDRYLQEIPLADGLDVMFLSYLERAVADKEYTSNHYSNKDLAELTKKSGVVFGNGEEHRHNFAGFGQGFGHVMLLNIKKLILPVSIGPGIMKSGTDGLPLQRGLNTARNDGATIVWCHNEWGLESTPNWINGKVDAQNIYDGGIRSSYKDSFYRYLNAGIKVPFSTGTDWFMYDFSRVYAVVDGNLTVESWLKALAAGRTFITNGPLLSLTVNRKSIGETVSLKEPDKVNVVATATGRVDFERAELIHNGNIVATAKTKAVGGHFKAKFRTTVQMSKSGWIAIRTPPPSVKEDPKLQEKRPLNELGRELFSHTSPIYVEIAGREVFDRIVAGELLAEMQESHASISKHGLFADDQERQRVLDVYRDGIATMKKRLEIGNTSAK